MVEQHSQLGEDSEAAPQTVTHRIHGYWVFGRFGGEGGSRAGEEQRICNIANVCSRKHSYTTFSHLCEHCPHNPSNVLFLQVYIYSVTQTHTGTTLTQATCAQKQSMYSRLVPKEHFLLKQWELLRK